MIFIKLYAQTMCPSSENFELLTIDKNSRVHIIKPYFGLFP